MTENPLGMQQAVEINMIANGWLVTITRHQSPQVIERQKFIEQSKSTAALMAGMSSQLVQMQKDEIRRDDAYQQEGLGTTTKDVIDAVESSMEELLSQGEINTTITVPIPEQTFFYPFSKIQDMLHFVYGELQDISPFKETPEQN